MIPKAQFQDGIKQCEINAYHSFMDAHRHLSQNDYRQAFLFGYMALEEIGKAGFIFDKWNEARISQAEWHSRQSFVGHIPKIFKAKKIVEKDVDNWFKNEFPLFKRVKFGILGWSDAELNDIWEYRNRVLYVGYNFDENKWESPQDIPDIEQRAMDVVSKAQSAFYALEGQLPNLGITPELTRIS